MNMVTRVEPAVDTRFDYELVAGPAPALDQLAGDLPPEYGFLRGAWFAAAGAERNLVVTSSGGRLVAAFPLVTAGPPALRASAVAGPYWPFRSPLLSPSLGSRDIAAILASSAGRSAFGPLWRMGPCYRDEVIAAKIMRGAAAAGWSVLTRRLGHMYSLDIGAAQGAGPWPRPSTLKRIRNYERQIARSGPINVRRISGSDWSPKIFDELAAVEAASWVGRTDRAGAKFVNPRHRAFWEGATADPVLAEMLSAFILRVGERPIAFCFDLNAGPLQYAIAGSFDEGFARQKVGKIATYRNIDWAIERGIARIDWGAGDSGYKTEIGAVQGSEIIDCLFTRSPIAAALLRPKWEGAATREGEAAGLLPIGRREMLVLGSLATAATFGMMAE
jgi:CelD/BcsL family acetyltransferase involved in cellulose biosynthesis